MRSSARVSLVAVLMAASVGLVGCGSGGGEGASSDKASIWSADYELERWSTIGLRSAFFTVTGRTDGKTTVVIDFYVPPIGGAEDDVYAAAVRSGDCDPKGEASEDFGKISSGATVLVSDTPIDDFVRRLESNTASVVIMTPKGNEVAWCGPLSDAQTAVPPVS